MQNSNGSAAQAKKRPRRRGSALRIVGRLIAVLIMIGIITGCIVASVLTVYVLNTLDSSDRIVLDSAAMSYTTIIYAQDSDTGEYVELQRVQNSENRIWVDYDDIPQAMKDAAVAVEDKRFWTHSGIDIRRTIAATINYLNPFASDYYGGSTITQQVVKNVTSDDDFRIDRKVREIFRAINLEKNYSKEQILETYLNTIALGNGTNGVQAAANLYFGKDVSDLTVAECASIIAITQNPTKWNPFTYPENNRERQLTVLYLMNEQGLLSDEEYEEACAQEMVFQTETYTESISTVQNWFIDTVYDEVLNDLVEKAGYTDTGAAEALRSEGLRIYTTVDPDMQDYLEQAYVSSETFPTINNAEYPESAFVILSLQGEIKAIVGSNREKTGARVFNRATSAKRQPGSSIKPLASYALAIEYNLVNYSTIMEDSPILLDANDPDSLWPSNAYNDYYGRMPLVEALQRSTNTVAVKLVQMLSPRTSFDFLTNSLGFTSPVDPDDADLAPMSIGAMTEGVTPLEMAAGYQIFGNGGLYYSPHSYTQVLDSEGNVILDNKVVPKRVISLETATIMNQLLQRVTDSSPGTGTRSRFGSMPVAGKTGTSQNDENQWFVGVTPYYVGVCWLGYDIPETINYSGHYYPPPIIWRNIMSTVHENLPVVDFTFGNSASVVQLNYCKTSGLLFNEEFCSVIDPSTGLETNRGVGYYKSSAIPEICTSHDFGTGDSEEEEEEEEYDPATTWDWDEDD
jgi:penicillin-binding protein 1A